MSTLSLTTAGHADSRWREEETRQGWRREESRARESGGLRRFPKRIGAGSPKTQTFTVHKGFGSGEQVRTRMNRNFFSIDFWEVDNEPPLQPKMTIAISTFQQLKCLKHVWGQTVARRQEMLPVAAAKAPLDCVQDYAVSPHIEFPRRQSRASLELKLSSIVSARIPEGRYYIIVEPAWLNVLQQIHTFPHNYQCCIPAGCLIYSGAQERDLESRIPSCSIWVVVLRITAALQDSGTRT
ncbi:hypothetical protein FB451DRAFT_1189208 [Mycena latifolia]|nr:hypothetical protein FB451DRAFT_1189208 [Mycena latifolia]